MKIELKLILSRYNLEKHTNERILVKLGDQLPPGSEKSLVQKVKGTLKISNKKNELIINLWDLDHLSKFFFQICLNDKKKDFIMGISIPGYQLGLLKYKIESNYIITQMSGLNYLNNSKENISETIVHEARWAKEKFIYEMYIARVRFFKFKMKYIDIIFPQRVAYYREHKGRLLEEMYQSVLANIDFEIPHYSTINLKKEEDV